MIEIFGGIDIGSITGGNLITAGLLTASNVTAIDNSGTQYLIDISQAYTST